MSSETPKPTMIACRQLVKSFDDGTRKLTVLKGVDLDVVEGEILAISGSSGAGKSTLMHILGTLDRPDAGELLFRGRPMWELSRKEIDRIRNEDVGFVFQFYHLLPEFTALENVMMPALARGKAPKQCIPRSEELLAKVGLADRMTHKPGMLSGGEQQRVAIARALFNKPSVVLADEPTGNLDETTGKGIVDLLWELNRDELTTMVLVTHDDDIAHRADRWIHLHEGQTIVRKG
ncbi:MAG: lipoprotein-releasing system ATP-binding protein LolD [Candidatus Hydrogenedentota bacterium]